MLAVLNSQISLFNDLERVNIPTRLQDAILQYFPNPVKVKALKEIQEAINSFKKFGTIDC